MLSFEQARGVILENVRIAGTEQRSLEGSVGMVMAEDFIAPWDLPLWNNSAMDGFAVRLADCSKTPVKLKVTGYIPAGGSAERIELKPGCAVKIMTGAPVPRGADAVVPEELTEATSGEEITVTGNVTEGDHIRFRGEDVPAGSCVMTAGTVIRPQEIGMLASMGKAVVTVYRQPVVAIVSTGDELVELGRTPGANEIINSNALALSAAVREAGAIPRIMGVARDNHESHVEKLQQGLQADMLITSAGVSAGDRDLVRIVLQELGVKQLFWKVGIKPGKPAAFGLKDGKPVFSLPGNPVSTLMTFEEFVRPALLRMMGIKKVWRPTFRAVLKNDIKNREDDRTSFLRVRIEREGEIFYAVSAGKQQTGLMKTLVNANAIAVIPPGRGFLGAGEEIEVHFLGSHIELV